MSKEKLESKVKKKSKYKQKDNPENSGQDKAGIISLAIEGGKARRRREREELQREIEERVIQKLEEALVDTLEAIALVRLGSEGRGRDKDYWDEFTMKNFSGPAEVDKVVSKLVPKVKNEFNVYPLLAGVNKLPEDRRIHALVKRGVILSMIANRKLKMVVKGKELIRSAKKSCRSRKRNTSYVSSDSRCD